MKEICPLCYAKLISVPLMKSSFGCTIDGGIGYHYFVTYDDDLNIIFENAKLSEEYFITLNIGAIYYKLNKIYSTSTFDVIYSIVMDNIPKSITIDNKLLDRLLALIPFS